MDHERKISQLDATYNDLTRERLNIERDLQEQKENEQKREELLQSNEILSVEILVSQRYTYRVSTAHGKQGKTAKKIPCQEKHREFRDFAKTQGIWSKL